MLVCLAVGYTAAIDTLGRDSQLWRADTDRLVVPAWLSCPNLPARKPDTRNRWGVEPENPNSRSKKHRWPVFFPAGEKRGLHVRATLGVVELSVGMVTIPVKLWMPPTPQQSPAPETWYCEASPPWPSNSSSRHAAWLVGRLGSGL